MPETTRSGLPSRTSSIAMLTQSVGVPSTEYMSLADLLEAQRPSQRQRVADRARFDLRRDDGDVAERLERVGEDLQSFGKVPVVIGHENASHRSRSF